MQVGWLHKKTLPIALAIATSLFWFQGVCTELVATAALIWVAQTPLKTEDKLYWSSCAGHFYLRIFILQWAHPIVGCMRPFKIVIMNELRDFLFNSVFIHSRSVT